MNCDIIVSKNLIITKIKSIGPDHHHIVLGSIALHLACVTNIANYFWCDCHLWSLVCIICKTMYCNFDAI